MKTNVKWIKNFQSVVDNGRGHETIMDLPLAKNGDDLGATALEYAAMSLSGCIATIFAVVASKMRMNFSSMEIEMDAAKSDEEPTITGVEFLLKIKTGESFEKVQKCLTLTMDTCPVGVLFEKAGILVKGTIQIV